MRIRTIKEEFLDNYHSSMIKFGKVEKMIVAVKLPTGAIEIIINTDDMQNKLNYYMSAYNDDMELNNNNDVKIVGVMFV